MTQQSSLAGVTLTLKANIYFDGNVVSHTITSADQPRRTIGIIRPGSYSFNTAAAERMEIIAGSCRVRLKAEADWRAFAAGQSFDVPANSRFDIAVTDGITEYLCTFM
jgi:hypothetical protein